MLRKSPSPSVWTLAPACISAVELGFPQYPLSPGGGPNLGCPSGQRGAGRAGGLSRRGSALDNVNMRLLVLVATIELPHACLLPSLAEIPCTVMPSPGFSVVRLQPLRCRSMGLSSSIAQLVTLVASCTSMK